MSKIKIAVSWSRDDYFEILSAKNDQPAEIMLKAKINQDLLANWGSVVDVVSKYLAVAMKGIHDELSS